MKSWLKLASGLAVCLGLGAVAAKGAEVQFSAGIAVQARGDFSEPLRPYGAWVEVGTYGQCWHPARVEVGWRPYCDGTWEWTDCGWYWASDEPWAWACYHYGRWMDDSRYGWVWVPDVEWAPAWVYWREGGDYIGWAPCPPTGIAIAPAFFTFVETRHFHERIRPSTVLVNNTTIIARTRLITEVKRDTRTINGTRQRVVINEGPGLDPIQRATGRKFNATPIHEAVRHTPAPATLKRGTLEPTGREHERERAVQERPTTEPPRERPPVTKEPPRQREIPREPPHEQAPPPTGRERGRVDEEERKVPPREHAAPERPAPEPEKGRGREKERVTP